LRLPHQASKALVFISASAGPKSAKAGAGELINRVRTATLNCLKIESRIEVINEITITLPKQAINLSII